MNHVNCRCAPTPSTRQYHEFHLEHAATVADIQDALRKLANRGVDPGFVVVSSADYYAIQNEITGYLDPIAHPFVALEITSETTERRVRVVVLPTLESGDVVFGSMENTEKSSTPRVFDFPIL